MADPLVTARKLVGKIRFAGDSPTESRGDSKQTRSLASFLLQNELEITPEVTPRLAAELSRVYEQLEIPNDQVHAFVYPAAELQAMCHASSTSECVLRFSSALIDLLEPHEFAFVCGHELGHFLLGHGVTHDSVTVSIEYFMMQRAKEVSADRVGLLACSSLDSAIRALMKTASGLSTKHLRFDVSTFIGQLAKSPEGAMGASSRASHPSILVRCRALLWFSLSNCFTSPYDDVDDAELGMLDGRIERDLEKYVDGPAKRQIAEAKETLAMWMAAFRIVQDGVFEKREQALFAEMFGADTLQRMAKFLENTPASDVEEVVYERVLGARKDLECLIPNRIEEEIRRIEDEVAGRFA